MSVLQMTAGLNQKVKVNQPEISYMPAQRMLTVIIKGDPNIETARLMGPLYGTAYAVRKIYKEQDRVFKVEKLRGRWPDVNADITKGQWVGVYALPVPNDVSQLPEIKLDKQVDGVQINLEDWEYGDVAYILHLGPYTEECGSLNMLKQFIQDNGYRVKANSHEEIYLSDPAKTTADKLKTILLYRIEKIKVE